MEESEEIEVTEEKSPSTVLEKIESEMGGLVGYVEASEPIDIIQESHVINAFFNLYQLIAFYLMKDKKEEYSDKNISEEKIQFIINKIDNNEMMLQDIVTTEPTDANMIRLNEAEMVRGETLIDNFLEQEGKEEEE